MAREKVLIIEDDPTLLRGLKDNFESRGYRVSTATDGEVGLAASLESDPDLIILDIMLPKLNGYEICRAVRERELETPIIMLTAKGQEEDIVRGLELGADDYVTKPFSIRELLARANAFLRRRVSGPEEVHRFGDCKLDLAAHKLFRGGDEVQLTPKEFGLLQYLVRNAGRALTRDQVLAGVWGSSVLVTTRSVDRCISTLRGKIEPDPRYPTYIQTIRDIGYRFEMPLEAEAGADPSGRGERATTLIAGTRLGRYEIRGVLGTGGMSEVYRARDSELEREVALKVLPRQLARNPIRQSRFHREARAVAALSHPNILTIYDVGRERGLVYAVTELLEGESLRRRLERGPLPWREAVEICVEVADGLAMAHTKGIVHRDIKPGNIFLTQDGAVKILDFGLARLDAEVGGASTSETPTVSLVTAPGTIMGTVAYMSPEQVRGQKADPRSDIFSLGCVLHEMLGGVSPFFRETAAETMGAILAEQPPALAESQGPAALQRVVAHCLEKAPEQRFQSAGDLAFALGGLVGA